MNALVADVLRAKGHTVETINPEATIQEAVKRMAARHIGCLAVMSRNGRLAGVITERDCMWKIVAEGLSARRALVKEQMTPLRKLTTITPEQTVDECMQLMTSGRFRHLLVVENKKLLGLVSIGDVVKIVLESQEAMIQSLEKYIEGTL